jgi:predicted dehydrogenase
MQSGTYSQVDAIASRDSARAEAAAAHLGVARSYGSYEALLADTAIDAVYIPLPNHMHVEWTIKAAEAGKHVLCEKPIALNAREAERLLEVRDRTGVRIQEGFMVRTHPQWLKVRELVGAGAIGRLQAIQGFFSFHKTDPENIRNIAEFGGGGMLDIGCYPIATSRFVIGAEPARIAALMEYDPALGIDRLGSVMLDFGAVQASFTYGTQLVAYQRMQFFGERGRLDVEIPFNAPADQPCRLHLDNGSDLFGGGIRSIEIAPCNQYAIQADAFSRAVLEGLEPPIPLEDAIANMRTIDAAFRAAESGTWERP